MQLESAEALAPALATAPQAPATALVTAPHAPAILQVLALLPALAIPAAPAPAIVLAPRLSGRRAGSLWDPKRSRVPCRRPCFSLPRTARAS